MLADSLPLVRPVVSVVYFLLQFSGAAVGVWAAVDAASRRPDAFTAADKQSKGVWSGITIACAVVFVLGAISYLQAFYPQAPFDALGLLWLAALIGTLVYLLDVRPRLREAQRGSRW